MCCKLCTDRGWYWFRAIEPRSAQLVTFRRTCLCALGFVWVERQPFVRLKLDTYRCVIDSYPGQVCFAPRLVGSDYCNTHTVERLRAVEKQLTTLLAEKSAGFCRETIDTLNNPD